MDIETNATRGLTYDAVTATWKTHVELGAEVYTIEEGIRHRNRHAPGRLPRALVVNRQIQFITAEFKEEWKSGRRKF